MPIPSPKIPATRIVILMPNWLGDAVMATPFLYALRQLYPQAHLAAVGRPLAIPVLAGLPWISETHTLTPKHPRKTRKWLRAGNFDLGIALPNSFRSALLLFRAHIPIRLGYAREWRSPLLTHRLQPLLRTPEQQSLDHAKSQAIRKLGGPRLSIGSKFQPTPAIDYYLELAQFLGTPNPSKQMHLAVTPEESDLADSALNKVHVPALQPLIILVPGANFGSSKCWPPDRFATVATTLIQKHHATVILASSPSEKPIIDAILASATQNSEFRIQNSLIPLASLNGGKGLPLGALKELTRRASLMICNDTGPRHFAAAFNIPTVTLFGPTDPRWAETFHPNERIIRVNESVAPCSPCQLKKCPIDHRCMTNLELAAVLAAAEELLAARPR